MVHRSLSNYLKQPLVVFPDDKIANLNAASAALSRKDTLLAEKYLKESRDFHTGIRKCRGSITSAEEVTMNKQSYI